MLQDKVLTSVVGIMTGESLSTSWWGHAKGQEIFACLESLDDSEVLTTRLVGGKVTFVDRALWPDFLAVAMSGEPWQKAGEGGTAREQQERLLVHAQEVHTASGRHETVLQPWSEWLKQHEVDRDVGVEVARHALEEAVVNIGGTVRLLPWRRVGKKK